MYKQSFAFALVLGAAQATLPATDLAGCEAFVAQFDNTCTDIGTFDLSNDDQAEVMTCTGDAIRCPNASGEDDYDDNNPCTFTRKLCVTCYVDTDMAGKDTVMVNVKTNGMPSHCFNSTVNNAVAFNSEWNVAWQPAVTEAEPNYTAEDFDTSAKTDDIVCDLQRTSATNMPAGSKLEDVNDADRRMLQPGRPPRGPGGGTGGPPGGMGMGGGSPLGTAAGIALSGGLIFNALDGQNRDAVENEGRTLDLCLSHPTPSSQFHYHYWTPCAMSGFGLHSPTQGPELCADYDGCAATGAIARDSVLDGQAALFSAERWHQPIGLARDGHLIMGPYKNDAGEEWTCQDRDVCNGAFIGDQYVYVGSKEFPYVVGCWGPGPKPLYQPGCTTNGCGTEPAENLYSGAVSNAVTSFGAACVAIAAFNF